VQSDPELSGDNIGERRLPKPRRPTKKHMIERVPALLGGFHKNPQVLKELGLSDDLGKAARSQRHIALLLHLSFGRAWP
jgi:hypothetical protein